LIQVFSETHAHKKREREREMESKKDERTWRDIEHVKVNRMEHVASTQDRSVDAKSYIEASGLEAALKEEVERVISMPSDLRPPPHFLLETIGKAFLRRTRSNNKSFVRRASNMSIGYPVSFPIDSDEDEDDN
jgi:hypothetical protein